MNREDIILYRLMQLINNNQLYGDGSGYKIDNGINLSPEEIQTLCNEHEAGTYITSNNGTVMKWVSDIDNFIVLEHSNNGLINTTKPLNFVLTQTGKCDLKEFESQTKSSKSVMGKCAPKKFESQTKSSKSVWSFLIGWYSILGTTATLLGLWIMAWQIWKWWFFGL